MPVFWSQEELAQLEGSYLLSQIADRNEAIAEDYHSICQVAPELYDLCSLEEFKWARMCVCSRNFGLQIDGHRTSALVPHADMLNHFRPRETKWTFDEEKQAFTITTLQSIPAGAQVYDSYGQKCNHRFLLNYGFAVEDNRELDGFCPNEVPIELSVSLDDPCFQKKVEFWTRGENASFAAAVAAVTTSQSQQAVINAVEVAVHQQETDIAPVKRVRVCVSNNENTRLLFSLLRTLVCTEDELSALSTDMVSRSLFGLDTKSSQPLYRSCRDIRHPVSLRNERATMRLLLDTVSIALSRYPTTLSKDTSDLMDEVSFPRFSNRRHAKIQVKGEKEVLTHFAKWANTALEVMDLIQEGQSIERTIANIEECGLHHTIIRYCADVLTALQREEMKNLRRRA
eukprot:CAMPEP_0202444688 /NCGR_PEP_ID=MMETSP1360-20130828/3655_1 /ASSEMBLY_ACC=CAM_ASM_000848 /TAXON_ID=515479 /ORGANISM="Licmophora paradoxa, Strain CCMP2313" /LENGTH=398 /DNA_ID=CAMNT_0049060717 /DNA_START=381 /DNA_END=1577 /DNA_ORIENTATION=+